MENFIKVWNSSKSASEASKKLNMPYSSATSTASTLRKKGFDVKKFPTGFGAMDKEVLKETQSRGGRVSSLKRREEKLELERLRNEQARKG